ncbi:PKD domain-containing protein [Mucilaginibacter sabulilitoris]|uniref:PKD domain-containing protein n=1 Tax=Mucilaginibacter sabulilitoris TaxID=1173583 RepID=A0ABZ0TS18_9SPHI|nr:PKD domain-containing protein [Mucilaginibacter sabulilitoris]WPU95709.1 PKD domain-containing protein [Mucilaginibacter sabulilitoris]
MSKKLFFLSTISFSLFLIFSGCKKGKDISKESPKADFLFRNINSESFKVGTNDTLVLANASKGFNAVRWNLGNGTIATGKNVLCSFSKPGTYTVTLTVKSENGDSSAIQKKIVVADRILKKIIIKSVFWDTKSDDIDNFNYLWPADNKADLNIKLQSYTQGDVIQHGILINSPVLYASSPIKNVSNKTEIPLEISVAKRVVLDKKMIMDRSLVLSLIAKDTAGKEYDIMSNRDFGSSWQIEREDIDNNIFVVSCKLFSVIELIGGYDE